MWACFAIALTTPLKHGGVKEKCFRGQFMKMKADAKSFAWNFFEI